MENWNFVVHRVGRCYSRTRSRKGVRSSRDHAHAGFVIVKLAREDHVQVVVGKDVVETVRRNVGHCS